MLGELSKLQQTSTVESVVEYHEKFESLRPFVLAINRSLDEDYFVPLYLSGLKEEIKVSVKMFKPKTLVQAFSLSQIKGICY